MLVAIVYNIIIPTSLLEGIEAPPSPFFDNVPYEKFCLPEYRDCFFKVLTRY